MGSRLGERALNRALLDRQLLLERSTMPVLDAIEHLVGLQSQNPAPPYVGLWTRLDGFHPDQLATLIIDRMAVRMSLLRGTVHLVSAADAVVLRAWLQPLYDRLLFPESNLGPGATQQDVDAVVEAGRTLLDEAPRTIAQLGQGLHPRWPDREPAQLSWVCRNRLPLVHVPPRGLWGKSGQTMLTTVESWLGSGLVGDPDPGPILLRYLAAFGPATVKDAQTWCGLTRLGEVLERLRPQLRTFTDERGRELFDHPDGPRPDPDTLAPVRFLPEYDNVLRSHEDRTRVLATQHRPLLATKNDAPMPTFLVDGFVAGTWRVVKERGSADRVRIVPFDRLAATHRAELTAEAERLADLVAPGGDVELAAPAG